MSLLSLPDVLCQSVMRLLDVPSLLRLARCKHRLSVLSHAPFVWAHSALTVRCTPQELLRSLDSTPSLRHLAELRFHWQAAAVQPGANPRAYRYAEEADVAALLSALDRGSLCLVELVVDEMLQMRDLLPAVLSAARVQPHLRVLRGASLTLSEPVVELMTRIPRLHALSCENEYGGDAAWLAELPRVPSLTDVSLFAGPDGADETCMPIVARCSGVRRLTLMHPRLAGSTFRRFFGSRHMRRLQFLCLRRLMTLCVRPGAAAAATALDAEEAADPLPPPDQDELASEAALNGLAAHLHNDVHMWGDNPTHPKDFIATFRRMQDLTEMELTECYDIEQMLPYVAHAPALRRLVIEPGLDGDYMDGCPSFPSAAGLQSLLEAAPALHVVLRMPPKIPDEDSGQYEHITEMRSKLRAMFGGAQFGPRFRLQHEEGYDSPAPVVAAGDAVRPPPVASEWAALLAAAQAQLDAAQVQLDAAAAAGEAGPQHAAAPVQPMMASQPGGGQ